MFPYAEDVGRVGGKDRNVGPLAQGLPDDVMKNPRAVLALDDLDFVDLDRPALPEPAGADDTVDFVGHSTDGVAERGPPGRLRLPFGLIGDSHGIPPQEPDDHPQEAQEKVRRSKHGQFSSNGRVLRTPAQVLLRLARQYLLCGALTLRPT